MEIVGRDSAGGSTIGPQVWLGPLRHAALGCRGESELLVWSKHRTMPCSKTSPRPSNQGVFKFNLYGWNFDVPLFSYRWERGSTIWFHQRSSQISCLTMVDIITIWMNHRWQGSHHLTKDASLSPKRKAYVSRRSKIGTSESRFTHPILGPKGPRLFPMLPLILTMALV